MFRNFWSRAHVVFVHDIVMVAVSFLLSLYLRLGDGMQSMWSTEDLWFGVLMFCGAAAPVFVSQRLYRSIWRYASLNDLVALTKAATLSILVFLTVLFLTTRLQAMPRSVLFINWFVLMALLGAPRFIYRMLKDMRQAHRGAADGRQKVPVLLVGAGDEAELFIRATRNPEAEYRAVGLIAAHGGRIGRHIHGIDVLGSADNLAEVIAGLRARGVAPQRLVITDHRMDGTEVRLLLDDADRLGMTLARIPRLMDLQDGVSDKLTIRPIAVEDLLGRPQAVLDREGIGAMIRGRRVLVTGAGGSIGSELVRQIAELAPARLVLFEACEFNLYQIDLEISQCHPGLELVPVLGDVRDAARIRSAFDLHAPELVFHAAALKHVPMVEHNPSEGLLTNVIGTRVVADACRDCGVELMVQISTDKAVNPTNVMGASKRIAEMYTQALDLAGAADIRYVTVRFGNVLGSTGSVVPLFQKQLTEGGPLTVTHPEMTRYFMTVREAVELVLQAAAFGRGVADYRGRIFVLDMGKPVRIIDLARQMIRLAGLRPEVDIGISITGLRPGEKLFEEIFHGAEPPMPTPRPGILVAVPRLVDGEELGLALDDLALACKAQQTEVALAILRRLVPEYQAGIDG